MYLNTRVHIICTYFDVNMFYVAEVYDAHRIPQARSLKKLNILCFKLKINEFIV